MRRADLAVDAGYLPPPEAPALLRRALRDPLCVPPVADSLAARVEEDGSGASALRTVAGLIDVPAKRDGVSGRIADPVEAVGRLYASCGVRLGEARPWRARFEALPGPVREAVAALMDGVARSRTDAEGALGRLTPEERGLAARATGLIADSLDEREARRIVAAAAKIDRGRMVGAALELMAAVEAARAALKAFNRDGQDTTRTDRTNPSTPLRTGLEGVEGDVLAAFETPAGAVIVGGPGRTVYRRPAAVILDLGGEDRYEGWAGAASGSAGLSASDCLDLGGDDVYVADGDVAQGAGASGVGVLVDAGGDDRYESRGGICQGSGVMGVGVALDLGGDDRYEGGIGCQGAGLFGVGLLMDGAGCDRYRAGAAAQGYGGTGGAGALLDRAGDDAYFAGGRLPDFREPGRFQSLGQGYGTGIRPFAAGGVGALLDLGGDDRYEADYFAQGSAYWTGAGLLIDRRGRDLYVARRYAQGSAAHVAMGALVDGAGEDVYRSWGVSQGCGHDLAVGWLLDRAGDDRYEATWLSQGAGSANGVGLLADGGGDDQYLGERNTQGSGVGDRGYGSIGILLDGGGTDRYSGQGRDGEMWRDGEYGAGLDADAEALW